jgi:hypothetical protein
MKLLSPSGFTACLFLFLNFTGYKTYAQFTDSFSDGNYTNNPNWFGDTSKFTVNLQNTLQLFTTGAGNAGLFLPAIPVSGDTEWKVLIRLTFAPSDNNYVEYWLMSADSIPGATSDGYFIRYGENGSADNPELWKRVNGNAVKILDGPMNPSATSTNQYIRLRIQRSATAEWSLEADFSGTEAYQTSSINSTDNSLPLIPIRAGIRCVYTSSNASRFYFDDFQAGIPIADTIPPTLLSCKALSPDTLKLHFSEAVSNGLNPASYFVQPGPGQADQILWTPQNPADVYLIYTNGLTEGLSYMLMISGLSDLSGNEFQDTTIQVVYYVPSLYDIVLTEVMADPYPSVGIPEAEYVEIYNRKSYPIDLSGWKIQSSSGSSVLPSGTVIEPSKCKVLLSSEFSSLFPDVPVVALSFLPSLPNGGTTLTLTSDKNVKIHQMSYDVDSYGYSAKSDGGYSLEMIHPLTICMGDKNYTASVNPSGGTPGYVNFDSTQVSNNAKIDYVFVSADSTILLQFNMQMDTTFFSPVKVDLIPENGTVKRYVWLSESLLSITFSEFFKDSLNYEITLGTNWKDCLGITHTDTLNCTFSRIVPGPFDVLITEIMADESPSIGLPDAEYVEILNHSPYALYTGGWRFRAGNSECLLPQMMLNPGSYRVYSGSAEYTRVKKFPTLTNTGTELVLLNGKEELLHKVNYSLEWYESASKSDGGWSLEMVDPANPCGSADNWKASVSPIGGTPGFSNSVAGINPDTVAPLLSFAGFRNDSIYLLFTESMYPLADAIPGYSEPVVYESNPAVYVLSGSPGSFIAPPNWKDCAGNFLKADSIYISATTDTGKISFQEVLFNPVGDNPDYIELMNTGNSYLPLNLYYIASWDSSAKLSGVGIKFSELPLQLAPGRRVLLTENIRKVLGAYPVHARKNFLNCTLPIMNNSGSSICIKLSDETILETFSFDETFHVGWLKNPEGAALEKILPEAESEDRYMWTTAAASVGFGTPGAVNSQNHTPPDASDILTAGRGIFSPDQDGFEDVLMLQIIPGYSSSRLTLDVYTTSGVHVKQLANGLICGSTETLSWDGSTDDGNRCGIGMYILKGVLQDANGKSLTIKKPVVLAAKIP